MSDLNEIAEQLEAANGQFSTMALRFTESRDGTLYMDNADEARFPGLLGRCLSLLNEGLGRGNYYSENVVDFVNTYSGGLSGGPSLHAVKGVVGFIENAVEEIRRKASKPTAPTPAAAARPAYVSGTRLAELSALPKGKWDLGRLTRMVHELNDAWERGNFVTVPMLVRAIKDHVPPIFGAADFAEVFNNSAKSVKGNLEHLENSLKHIADGQLHLQVRRSEVLPNESQVDFRRDLDVLLGEVVRVLKV
jgi:hypothetical protein